MIVGVAIKNDNFMITLPKPNRHCDCFRYMAEVLGIEPGRAKVGVAGKNQGFYTHTGRYLDREQAAKYVKRVKQPLVEPAKKYLFSEDLW